MLATPLANVVYRDLYGEHSHSYLFTALHPDNAKRELQFLAARAPATILR
jgi:hypothetical protein